MKERIPDNPRLIKHIFLTSVLAGGDWSASRSGRFTSEERAPGSHWIGGWVDPRAGLDDLENENSYPHRDLNPSPSVVQPVASRYSDYAIPALILDVLRV
jgi:hypothetical protein